MCRTVRDLSVIDVVPLDVLLEVLGCDARAVAERVHRLLLPSYFSGPEEGPACMAALLRRNPEVRSCAPHSKRWAMNGPCHALIVLCCCCRHPFPAHRGGPHTASDGP